MYLFIHIFASSDRIYLYLRNSNKKYALYAVKYLVEITIIIYEKGVRDFTITLRNRTQYSVSYQRTLLPRITSNPLIGAGKELKEKERICKTLRYSREFKKKSVKRTRHS